MKKWTLFLSLYFCICLLAACAGFGSTSEEAGRNPENATEEPAPQPGDVPGDLNYCAFRIVDGAESGQLLLAKLDGASGDVYTLSLADAEKWELPESLRNGQLLQIAFDSVLETWPAQFGSVLAVELPDGGFDDRCALYLRVLEDLWEKDSGLNGGVEVIGVDLSQTSLSPAEQSAVAWVFAGNHGTELAVGSLDELTEQGYITATPLSNTGSGADLSQPKHYFYEWENGCHFSIIEQPMEGTYSLLPVTFDAQKWRSSLGAYYFSNCTALQSAVGEWSDYHIGAEMIS